MASVRIKRRARQKTECSHPLVTESALVADTLILKFMTTQQRNYREKNYKGLKIFKAKDANKAREGGGRLEESQARKPNCPPRTKPDGRHRDINKINQQKARCGMVSKCRFYL